MQISGKVFAVTGGGNGIGREVVLGLVAKGARVAALDLNEEGLAETVKLAGANGDRISTHVVNVTDRKAVEKLPAAIIKQHGQVDGLLNIAGIIQKFVPVMHLDWDQIERVIDVNLYGVLNTCKAFLPELVKRPEAALVNVASMGAYAPVPGQGVYGATKAAVAQLSRALHSELMETGVQVTGVFPGAIGTNISINSGIMTEEQAKQMAANAGDQARKTTAPAEAGRQIIEAIEKGSYEIFIGGDAKAMSRLSRLNPKNAAGLIYKNMKDLLASMN
ncbi:SDR family NAD(P)-dependent oxidoreductase [Microcella frigidaquae]|uniref:Short-subunit dehydrogenase n=1 Tax=Microcella frigidaquae TaxID=424758 RepID=A0A840XBX5_9MICO|nr:SDR family oxidoreductase [Microcella frigidaquae]MBB5618644.1 short-subunit dehydrogenase [Microcella frigidaquae]NHN44078.1 SDR family oxidoreductase [Microcella frigidaquae]